MSIFYMHQLHELSLPCPLLLHANRNILERVPLLLLWPWFTTSICLFIMQSSFVLLNASRQDLCHMTRLANVEGIPFSNSKHFSQLLNVIISSQKMLGIEVSRPVVSFWQITDFNQSIDCNSGLFSASLN